MTTPLDEEFAPAEESIGWAQGATDELDSLIQRFFEGDVAELVVEVDPDTGENVQKIKFKSDIPKDFRRKATEALNSARHSFDQSVFAARNILGNRSAKGVNFPWATDPNDLTHHLGSRDIDPRLWDTIRPHEPYPTSDKYLGGNDLIRTLATIANNKHTVGLTVAGHLAETRFPEVRMNGPFQVRMPRWDTRKNEIELIRCRGDIETKGEYRINFMICLKDTRLSQPTDAIGALRLFTQKAETVCKDIKAKCLELTQ